MADPFSKGPPRVAVLVDTSTDWSRGAVAGIHRYAREHGGWRLFVEPRGVLESLELPPDWRGDGVIARIHDRPMADRLVAYGLPVVNISAIQTGGPEFPRVAQDVAAGARTAAGYFLDRGYRNFGYLSLLGLEYAARQQRAFVDCLAGHGHECRVHGERTRRGSQFPEWNLRLDRLAGWLKSLPKPAAVLTWSGGREVIHACERAGIRVPEDLALLSGSDDLICETCHVPISAVRHDSGRIGYEAARTLEKLMAGEEVPALRLIEPKGVVGRRSTESLAVGDPALADALVFILDHIHRPLSVDEVARRAGVSRRVLERRFREHLGRAPAEHIRLLHLDRARELLRDTDLPVPDVAERSGLGSPEHMAYLFRKRFGVPPLRFRREARSG